MNKEIKAKAKFVRGSARKARIPATIVKGMHALQAVQILKYTPKKAALDVKKVVDSAISNAKNNFDIDPASLIIKEIKIDEGPRYKRFKPGSRGGYRPYVKYNCHISVVLESVEGLIENNKAKKAESETKEEVSVEKVNKVEKKTKSSKTVAKKTTSKNSK